MASALANKALLFYGLDNNRIIGLDSLYNVGPYPTLPLIIVGPPNRLLRQQIIDYCPQTDYCKGKGPPPKQIIDYCPQTDYCKVKVKEGSVAGGIVGPTALPYDV
jgi:hypothetical protein